MEEIRWIHSIDCRVCVLEIRDAPRRKMEQIVNERKHTPKCRGCERLANVTEEMGTHENKPELIDSPFANEARQYGVR